MISNGLRINDFYLDYSCVHIAYRFLELAMKGNKDQLSGFAEGATTAFSRLPLPN